MNSVGNYEVDDGQEDAAPSTPQSDNADSEENATPMNNYTNNNDEASREFTEHSYIDSEVDDEPETPRNNSRDFNNDYDDDGDDDDDNDHDDNEEEDAETAGLKRKKVSKRSKTGTDSAIADVITTPSPSVTRPPPKTPSSTATATTPSTSAAATPTTSSRSGRKDARSTNNKTSGKKRKGMPAGLGGSRKGRAPAVSGLTIPFRTVKKVMKLDPDIPIVQNEAAIMTTLASELFLQALAQESHKNARARGRNTIRYGKTSISLALLFLFSKCMHIHIDTHTHIHTHTCILYGGCLFLTQ